MEDDLRESKASSPEEGASEKDFRVVTKFLLGGKDSLPKSANEKCEKIIEVYGTDFIEWIWAPNASDNQPLNPPSGFSMVVKSTSPVIASAFHPEKMFYGTAAFCLDGITFADGSPITEEHLIQKRDEFKRNINSFVPEQSGDVIRMSDFDEGTKCDKKQWKEQLGKSGAYAGIFSSIDRGNRRYTTKYWLVVQSGYAPISEDLYRNMEDTGKETTWKNFFLSNPNTLYVHECVRRNRNRLLYKLAQALALDVDRVAKNDLQSIPSRKVHRILEPTIETISHTVVMNQEHQMVYHNNTVNPESVPSQGTLFNESPLLGPVLLKGPPQNGKPFGLSWCASKDSRGTFPCCTGRQKKLSTSVYSSNGIDAKPVEEDLSLFVWEHESESPNTRLSEGVYRSRDVDFKKIETELGYNHVWGEVQMRPLIVKISSCTSAVKSTRSYNKRG